MLIALFSDCVGAEKRFDSLLICRYESGIHFAGRLTGKLDSLNVSGIVEKRTLPEKKVLQKMWAFFTLKLGCCSVSVDSVFVFNYYKNSNCFFSQCGN